MTESEQDRAIRIVAEAICEVWPKLAATCGPQCFSEDGEPFSHPCPKAVNMHGWRARNALEIGKDWGEKNAKHPR